MVYVGSQGQYSWIEFEWNAEELPTLIKEFPQLLVGRYVAITSHDSGPMPLDDHDLGRGWSVSNGVAVSPRIRNSEDIPHTCGWDEWWTFVDEPAEITPMEAFINNSAFTLVDPPIRNEGLEDEAALQYLSRQQRRWQDAFWSQIARVGAEAYLADGERLLVAHQDASMVRAIKTWAEHPSSA